MLLRFIGGTALSSGHDLLLIQYKSILSLCNKKSRPTHLLEDQALHQQEEAVVDPGRTNLGQFSQSEDLEEVDQMKKATLAAWPKRLGCLPLSQSP